MHAVQNSKFLFDAVYKLINFQDNCGSFDRLIPLLTPKLSYLAIDLPGHGLSSRFPKGVPYSFDSFPYLVRRIVQHFNFNKLSIIGHSLGGWIAYKYGTLYPEEIDFMINLDGVQQPFFWRSAEFERLIMSEFFRFDNLPEENEPPSYEWTELCERLHESSRNTINVDVSPYLLKRNTQESKSFPGKYFVTRDPKLRKGFCMPVSPEQILEDAKRVTFPLCSIIPDGQSPFYTKGEKFFEEFTQLLKSNNPGYEMHYLDGTHHFHLNRPETVFAIINEFIEKYDADDRVVTDLETYMSIVFKT